MRSSTAESVTEGARSSNHSSPWAGPGTGVRLPDSEGEGGSALELAAARTHNAAGMRSSILDLPTGGKRVSASGCDVTNRLWYVSMDWDRYYTHGESFKMGSAILGPLWFVTVRLCLTDTDRFGLGRALIESLQPVTHLLY